MNNLAQNGIGKEPVQERTLDVSPNRAELLNLIENASEKECEIILQFAVHLLKR